MTVFALLGASSSVLSVASAARLESRTASLLRTFEDAQTEQVLTAEVDQAVETKTFEEIAASTLLPKETVEETKV